MKHIARYALRVTLVLGLAYVGWLAFRSALRTISCGSEQTLKVEELSDLKFEVTYLSCDTIAKDVAIRVYAETKASDRSWLFRKWGNQRVLLFRYEPSRDDSPLPSITRPSPSTILISIPEVSSIAYQNREWSNMSVDYQIGHVDYPPASK